MNKAVFLAVAVLAGLCSSASAKTVNYTLSGHCDGFTLTLDGIKVAGTHTGCTNNDLAGGVYERTKGNSIDYVDLATSDALNAPGITQTYFLNFKELVWYLYESDGTNFNFINSGTLVRGRPRTDEGLKSSSVVTHPGTGPDGFAH